MIKIFEAYFEGRNKKLGCEADTESEIRPAWIRLKSAGKIPKFIKVLGKDKTAHYYKHRFGGYFLPVKSNLEETKLFYKKVAKEFDKITEENNRQFGEFIFKKLSEMRVPKSKSILDVCAGTGVQSQVLIEKGYKEISLLDFSPEMLSQAKRKQILVDNANFILADVSSFLSKKKYDVLISSMGFQYFDNYIWHNVLKRLKNILNKDGLLMVVEDNKRAKYPTGFKIIEEGTLGIDLKTRKKSTKFFFILKRIN